ncbi:putative sugar transporter [Rosellinia necatrix]|uniref:Putative sugar transporter n=1 Tax=Rosellinia necatrix TaxID=77044 RepID=A0A1S8AA13_ROSNE|nr:putative sugar transporter [Rosellinia necatrix]
MVYSLGFGAINFFFALPAIRTIDTLGRRKWLVLTLPLMCLFLTGAALATAFIAHGTPARDGIVTLFIFLFAATYSPGLGTCCLGRGRRGLLILRRADPLHLGIGKLPTIAPRGRMRFRRRDESRIRGSPVYLLPNY